jgi:hypothetical protein
MFKKVTEKQNGKKTEFTVHLACDICGDDIIKIVQRARASALMNLPRHFCNHTCYAVSRKRGGLSYNLSQETCREKYGAEHHLKSPEFKKKFDDLFEEKHGVRNAMQTDEGRRALSERMNRPEVKEQSRKMWIENNPAKRPEVKEKIAAGLKNWALTTHGVENASQVPEIYRKGRQKCIEKYGNEHPIRVLEERRQTTCLQKYGSTNPFNSKHVRDKWSLEKWGMTWEERNASLPEYEKYCRAVWKVTNTQQLETVEGYSMRGKDFHLDHKFSISEGFKQNISPEVIGNIVNLRVISARENISKSDSCSITKEELLLQYEIRKGDK